MREEFFEYFIPSKQDLETLLGSATFILDANVLLDLYRFSETTRDEYLRLLERNKERLWMPYTCGKEYLQGRNRVISQECKKYRDSLTDLGKVKDALLSYRFHPFIEEKTGKELEEKIGEACNDLKDAEKKLAELRDNDSILERLAEIFEGKTGTYVDFVGDDAIRKQAETRFKRLIPPGYKDSDKHETRRYGDYFIWREVLEFAKENKVSIILVTSEKKGDWWLIDDSGELLGPRSELIREFSDFAGEEFYLYSSDLFFDTLGGKEVSKEAKEEVKRSGHTLTADAGFFSYLGSDASLIPTETQSLSNAPGLSTDLHTTQVPASASGLSILSGHGLTSPKMIYVGGPGRIDLQANTAYNLDFSMVLGQVRYFVGTQDLMLDKHPAGLTFDPYRRVAQWTTPDSDCEKDLVIVRTDRLPGITETYEFQLVVSDMKKSK